MAASCSSRCELMPHGLFRFRSGCHIPYVTSRRSMAWLPSRMQDRRVQHVQAAVEMGPERPPKRKPEWVRLLEEDADFDEDIAKVLNGANGDPDKIRDNMRAELQNKNYFVTREGIEIPPKVVFRQINPFRLWIWFEFVRAPSERERDLFESMLKAWFMVGKLGGYNSQNLQVYNNAGDDQSFFEYQNEDLEESMASFLHDVGEVEYKGAWGRFRLDMGTCDELAVDILLNMMLGFSKDFAGLKRIYVGGENKKWTLPEEPQEVEEWDIDPMRLPQGLDDELGLLDDVMEEQRQAAPRDQPPAGWPFPTQQGQSPWQDSGNNFDGDFDGYDDGDTDEEEVGRPAHRGPRRSPLQAPGMQRYSMDAFRRAFPNRPTSDE